MSIREILNSTTHRPWNHPNRNWSYYQEWNHVIFLHWEVELSELKKFVPEELEIDLFEGKPWVSFVLFTMEKIRPRGIPSFAPISNFDEINIRTYIKSKEKTGVYFLSVEAGKSLSCKIARTLSKLPYRYSKINRKTGEFKSSNPEFGDHLDVAFEIGKKIKEKSELDKWLTERYALFQDTEKSINKFEIHHLEWELNEVELSKVKLDYDRFGKLINDKPAKIHYSEGVKVLTWAKFSELRNNKA